MSDQFEACVHLLIEELLIHNERVFNPFKIVFVHSLGGLPEHCSPVVFSPAPPSGAIVDTGFHRKLASAIDRNSAVHDGALGFEYNVEKGALRLSAWGVRLFPPDLSNEVQPNRGMAFNSALNFSAVHRVLRVVLFSGATQEQFANGRVQ